MKPKPENETAYLEERINRLTHNRNMYALGTALTSIPVYAANIVFPELNEYSRHLAFGEFFLMYNALFFNAIFTASSTVIIFGASAMENIITKISINLIFMTLICISNVVIFFA